jgi:hypothetical protein
MVCHRIRVTHRFDRDRGASEKEKFMPRAIRFTLFAVGAVVLSWLVVRFGDVLFGWALFGWFFRRIQGVGVLPDAISSAAAIWCVAAIIVAGPTILLSIFAFGGRRRRAIITVASAVSIWFVALYLLAGMRPKEYLFNPATGETNYSYNKDANGNVALFPKEYRFDPATGAKLTPLDAAVAQEYYRQKGLRSEEVKQTEALRQEQVKFENAQAELRKQQEEFARQVSLLQEREAAAKAEAERAKQQAKASSSQAVVSATQTEPPMHAAPEAVTTQQPARDLSEQAARSSQPAKMNYDAEMICSDDPGDELHYERRQVEYFIVKLREGCWSAVIYVPNSWGHTTYAESVGEEPGWWMARWLDGGRYQPEGPFWRNDSSLSPYHKGWYTAAFRLQGRGEIYLSNHPRH